MDRNDAGFTLLEMLVALCILSLLSVYAMQTFQHIHRMETVLDSIERRNALEAIELHLRNVIAAARPAIRSANGEAPTVEFSGEESQLRLVVASEGILERGGLLSVEIGSRRGSDGSLDLITRRAPYRPVKQSTGEALVLIEQIGSFSLRYYGRLAGDQTESWHSHWHNQVALPRLVEISIEMSDRRKRSRQKWMLRPVNGGQ